MFESIKADLKELLDDIKQGNISDALTKCIDLLDSTSSFLKKASEIFSLLAIPRKGNRKAVSIPSANECEEIEFTCNAIKTECTRKSAATDEKEFDPATILVILEIVGKALEMIKKWREWRNKK